MNDLETALKNHDWSVAGYKSRSSLDLLMKDNTDQAKALCEQY